MDPKHLNLLKQAMLSSSQNPSFKYCDTRIEKNDTLSREIMIHVPDEYYFAMNDILMSLNNRALDVSKLKQISYSTSFIKCCLFINLKIEKKYLDYLEFNNENFEMFLKIYQTYDFNEPFIKFILEKIPNNYDLNKLDKILFKKILELHGQKVISVGLNATHSFNNTIKIWNSYTGSIIEKFEIDRNTVTSISHDKKYVALGDTVGDIKIFDIDDGKIISNFKAHDTGINYLIYQPNNLLISAANDKTVKIWHITLCLKEQVMLVTLKKIINTAEQPICLALLSNILAIGNYKKVDIWDLVGEKITQTLESIEEVKHLLFLPDNKLIACYAFGTTKIWDYISANIVKILDDRPDNTHCVVFNQTNNLIATCSDNSIKIWDGTNYNLIKTLTDHTFDVSHIEFSEDNNKIISASFDQTVKIWDIKNGLLKTFDHKDLVLNATFLPVSGLIKSMSNLIL